MNFKKNDIAKYSVVLGFAIIYSIISFVNHYLFRTNAHDFGIFNQALWDYAHFRTNNNSVVHPGFGNLLSDHFELLLVIFSPLYWVFGSYTLLIIQIAAILIGGQGIYKYVELISNKRKLALAALIQFFLFFGIYSSLAFDYHNNVVGTMAVPWIFYFFKKGQWKQTIFAFVIFIISKENMALWGFFIFIGSMIQYRKDRKRLVISAILATVSIIYFIIIMKWVMPSLLTPGNNYQHFKYTALGNNMGEVLSTIFTKPFYTIKLLFVNHLGLPEGNYIKLELHLAVLLSGGLLLFFRPYYLLMLLPIYGQKLFFDSYTLWGLSYHYSVEFIPIISIGAFSLINDLDKEKTRRIIVYTLIIFTAAVTFRSFDHTYTYFRREKQRIYQSPHYTRNFNVKEAYAALKTIPDNAIVCAQDEFVPHLCFRKYIYLYPSVEDAEYIVLSDKLSTYPLKTEKEYRESITTIMNSGNWDKIYDKNFMLILKRK
jgi:uncharacterized membrane protein